MPIIEPMQPIKPDTWQEAAYQQYVQPRVLYRLNYMGQRIEGLTKQDLLAIMNAIRNNSQFLR